MKKTANRGFRDNVLLAVVKDGRDLRLILKKRLYRIPIDKAPKRKARYIAFYQPSSAKENLGLFRAKPAGFEGLIRYWAKIDTQSVTERMKIIPDEPEHPRSRQNYRLVNLGSIRQLKPPITNKRRMRVVFGFTSLYKLKSAREVKELFDVPPLEEIVERILKDMSMPYSREYRVTTQSQKRYRLDFALPPQGPGKQPLGIECDGTKAHGRPGQKQKDSQKDRDLESFGWKILRLSEHEILDQPEKCRQKIKAAFDSAGTC